MDLIPFNEYIELYNKLMNAKDLSIKDFVQGLVMLALLVQNVDSDTIPNTSFKPKSIEELCVETITLIKGD